MALENYNTGSQFEDFTIGVDKKGMMIYRENLKTIFLTKVRNKIENVSDLVSKIQGGWKGESCDKYLKNFEIARANIIADLEKEYNDIDNRLIELEAVYFATDKNIMGGE